MQPCYYRTVFQSSAHRLDVFCHCLFASSCFKNTYCMIATLCSSQSLSPRARRDTSQTTPIPHDGQINTNAPLILYVKPAEVWATERDASLSSDEPRDSPAVFVVVGVFYRQQKFEMLTGESVLGLGTTACCSQ